ncbi:GNAT family N-acetyltransferase [Kitasatospora sp. NPDC094019]|uniref:GNAT family N-acetyltransferase n=1 Tax=Kitasatospora sp. NPDC094019 TaxID=3364091 RepID=UPI0037F3A09A
MQGQSAHPDPGPGRARRAGRHPVRLHRAAQPGGGRVSGPVDGHTRYTGSVGGTGTADDPAEWGDMATDAGEFRLRRVRLPADLGLLTRWMNDPEVAAYWELAGPAAVTERHLRAQLDGDGRSLPCLGLLDDTPMSYWEVYRADLDPLAAHYPARPHDAGLHLLLGPAGSRGRGLGTILLAALTERVLREHPRCERVVAEPDVRNRRSVRAFRRAGFRLAAELDLPDKRAALMVRDRTPHPA